jgi:uncharacterized protein (DUF433 family)
MDRERIVSRPEVMFGKPVIRGTRVPVEQVLRELASGMDTDEVLQAHPRLTAEDVRAALAFAAEALAGEEILYTEKEGR